MNTTEPWPLPSLRLRPVNMDDSATMAGNEQQNVPTVNIIEDNANPRAPPLQVPSHSEPSLLDGKDMYSKQAGTVSEPSLSKLPTVDDFPLPPLTLAQSRRLQRYTLAESDLLRRASHVTAEPSSRELQIKVLQQATSLLSSYAERSKEHADRLRSLTVDSHGELDEEAYRELKKQRWIEERRQVKLESEKKAASEQLSCLLNSSATFPAPTSRMDRPTLDGESKRCANLLRFFANSDSLTLVPISFGKGPATYDSMSAIQSNKRKHTSADGYPLPLETLNSLSSKSAKQRLRASTSALSAPQRDSHGPKRRLRRPTSLILEVDTPEPSRLRHSPSSSTVRSSPSQLSLATLSDATHPTPITGDPVMSAYHAKHSPPSRTTSLRQRTDSAGSDGRYGIATIYTQTPPEEPPTPPQVNEKVQLPGYAISLINSLDEIHESFSLKPFNARTITARKPSPQTIKSPPPSAAKPHPAARSGKKGPPRDAKALSTISEAPSMTPGSKFSQSSGSSSATSYQAKRPDMASRSRSISSFREVMFGRDRKKEEEDKEGLKVKMKKRFSGLFA